MEFLIKKHVTDPDLPKLEKFRSPESLPFYNKSLTKKHFFHQLVWGEYFEASISKTSHAFCKFVLPKSIY